jgi:enoyl-CoA hydratase/carnithine racemase
MNPSLPSSEPQLQIDGPVATVTLNRPAHRNRLERDDLVALMRHFDQIEHDLSVRVLVLSSQTLAERPVFCSGYHIGQHGGEHPDATFEQVADRLERLRPVTVCGLNGSVYGGATDLVLGCDFAIGVQGMEMRMPAAALGLHYYPGGVSRFVSRLGLGYAKRAFLGADTFRGEELLAMQYVQALVPVEQHAAAVAARVAGLLKLGPLALQSLKQSLNEVARGDFQPERLRARMAMTQQSADFRNACQAFTDKRPVTFTGT